ncbi:MAG TPA: hypothetical protein VGC55_15550 [Dokdonella sp.]
MGWWGNTTYIASGDAAAVAAELAAVFAAEGMPAIAPPPARRRLRVEPMQYENALGNDLWGAAVFPGASGWTVVQTAPLDLLGERAAGVPRMRLAELARRLGTQAFQLNVYDSTGIVLVESDAAGHVLLSGITLQGNTGADPMRWQEEALDAERLQARFRLLPFNDMIVEGDAGEDIAARLAARFGGRNAAFCDNGVSVGTLIEHTPFDAEGGRVIYARWPGATRQRYAACADWDAWRAAIASTV